MIDYHAMKLDYIKEIILPKLKHIFKYESLLNTADEELPSSKHLLHQEIRHIRRFYVNTQLLEAEELAEKGDEAGAFDKIELAISYLIKLRMKLGGIQDINFKDPQQLELFEDADEK
jgi:hypothetical protein